MTARTLLVVGTSSDAGKSTLVTALARLLAREGVRVAPFKAQNMARNAYVTDEGGEIGVAQAMQAFAARVVPSVDMNPILLKPEPGLVSQVIVHGRSRGVLGFDGYTDRSAEMKGAVRESLERLRARYDVVILEGAGSPAEVNLQDRDLANLFAAREADADILLVGDIDRGGVFASLVGTIELLPDDIRARVRGIVINKLRGNAALLTDGLRFLEERTGVPVLGVVPHLPSLGLADEDSLGLAKRHGLRRARLDEIEIAVIAYPAIANAEDVVPFEREDGVVVRFVESPREIEGSDLVVLPGSKSTMHDLAFLREHGFDRVLTARAARGEPILGICGGCQMLGRAIDDPHLVEGTSHAEGLGLLPITTSFEREKRTTRVRGTTHVSSLFGARFEFTGFEIHHGRIRRESGSPALSIVERSGALVDDADGAIGADGAVVGTMVHELFETASARDGLLASLRAKRGLPHRASASSDPRDAAIDRLADHVAASLDFGAVRRMLGV